MPGAPLRVIFAGTPDFAALHLRALIDSEHQLLAAYTQPDRRAGRGRQLRAGPVKQLALDTGLPVFQPASLKDPQAQDELAALAADVMIVVAYGLILPAAVLAAPTAGCLNVHASLLPRWRGAAPIQRAIEAGDETTGVTIMQMDEGLDTGAMLATRACPIGPLTNAAELHDTLATLGPGLLLEVLGDLPGHQSRARAQDEAGATYAHKIDKEEAAVDWRCSADEIARRIRAFNPAPVCHGRLGGERIRLWRASPGKGRPGGIPAGTIVSTDTSGIVVSCGDGVLTIESLQLPGGKVLDAVQVLAARQDRFAPGLRFDPLPDGD
jgi:methionyl-tRNA formyltransferase